MKDKMPGYSVFMSDRIHSFSPVLSDNDISAFPVSEGLTVFPGFCDVHVHFREPGFSYKETIADGSRAAARGGYTAVCAMPNLDPVPDTAENLEKELEIIRRDAVIDVLPYGSITVGEKGENLSEINRMAGKVVAFSDDGVGIQSREVMREAMLRIKDAGKITVCHCEDRSLLRGGCIHEGNYARAHGHPGICRESEWRPIERDLELAKETGAPYHVCHVSCRESVELIRQAKRDGVDVTCETAPHYLLLDENDLREDGRFKMNPPLRGSGDRFALLEGLRDGTIDMIATDHAPHGAKEKSRGLAGSPFGVVGLETAFPLLYTYLVREDVITLEKLVELMAINPRERFGIPLGDGFTVFDLGAFYTIDPADFLSKGKSTPFEGRGVRGKCVLTHFSGRNVYTAQ